MVTDWQTKKILDHGFVHLLDTMPHWSVQSADSRVVQAARVSMAHLPSEVARALDIEQVPEDRSPAQDEKLIHYLMRNRHTSPFEKVRFEFVVKLPIFIARQWIRHRMGSFNEVSARYSKLPRELYIPPLERMQKQALSNKQASGEPIANELAIDMQARIRGSSNLAYENYEALLEAGLARELARIVLPLNVYTTWYWTVDLHNLMHFLKLRMHDHAQSEIRAYGDAIYDMACKIAPVSMKGFEVHVLGELMEGRQA